MSKEIIRNLPTQNSSDKVWMTWYDALEKQFGKQKANALFSANWDAKNGDGSVANTTDLRSHMEKKGLDISGGFFGEAKDRAYDVADFFGDYFTVGKWVGIGLLTVIGVSVGALVFQLATKSSVRREAVNIGSAVATRGLSTVGKK